MKKPTCETCVHFEIENPYDTFKEHAFIPGMCLRFPKWESKIVSSGCGEHPDFPAWMEKKDEKKG